MFYFANFSFFENHKNIIFGSPFAICRLFELVHKQTHSGYPHRIRSIKTISLRYYFYFFFHRININCLSLIKIYRRKQVEAMKFGPENHTYHEIKYFICGM